MSIIESFGKPVMSMVDLADVLEVAALPGSRSLLVRRGQPRQPKSTSASLLDVDTRELTEMNVEGDAGHFACVWGVAPETALAAQADTGFELAIRKPKVRIKRRIQLGEAEADSHVTVRADRTGEVVVALTAGWLCSSSTGSTNLVEPADGKSFFRVAVSSDGRFVANGRSDGLLEVRDSKSLSVVRSFKALESPVLALAFSPDGRYLAAADDSVECALVDLESGQSRSIYAFSKVLDFAWLSDSKGFVAVGISRAFAAFAVDELDEPKLEIRREDMGNRYFMGGALVGDDLLAIVVEDRGILLASLTGASERSPTRGGRQGAKATRFRRR